MVGGSFHHFFPVQSVVETFMFAEVCAYSAVMHLECGVVALGQILDATARHT